MSRPTWRSEEWKVNRDKLIDGKTACEWCGKVFDSQHPPVVHHLGNFDWDKGERIKDCRYIDMVNVAVICKGCHVLIHRGVKRGHPGCICKKCGGLKRISRYENCYACHRKEVEGKEALEELAYSKYKALDEVLTWCRRHKDNCPSVSFSFYDGGRGSGPKCSVERAVRRYPGVIVHVVPNEAVNLNCAS